MVSGRKTAHHHERPHRQREIRGGVSKRAWKRLRHPQKIVVGAMLAYIVLRSALLFTLDNSEQRYTLEFFPLFFVLGAYALTTLRKTSAG